MAAQEKENRGRGRPTVRTPEAEKQLADAFMNNFSVTEACHIAGVDRRNFYNWMEDDPEFFHRMTRAQNFIIERSRQVVLEAVQNGDDKVARWVLERKQKDEWSPRTEHTGKDGRELAGGKYDDSVVAAIVADAIARGNRNLGGGGNPTSTPGDNSD